MLPHSLATAPATADVLPAALTLAALLAGTGLALWAVGVAWTAAVMHRPVRMTPGRALARLDRLSPADLDLQYAEVTYDVPDAARPGRTLRMTGWWIPCPGRPGAARTVVLVHGFADAKVGALAWSPTWARLGFNGFLIDLRAHGESDGSWCSGGVWEREDLCHALDALRREHPVATRELVLFGVSLGGLVAAGAAARREDVAALVLESPVADWGDTTLRAGRALGLPLVSSHRLRLWLAERFLKVRFADARLPAALGEVACPVLAILPTGDGLISPADRAAVAAAARATGGDVWEPDAPHNLALARDPAAYEATLANWLGRVLSRGKSHDPSNG